MPELNEEIKFDVETDQATFHTKTNGDALHINGLHLTKEQAASLAWLVNQDEGTIIEIEIKVK